MSILFAPPTSLTRRSLVGLLTANHLRAQGKQHGGLYFVSGCSSRAEGTFPLVLYRWEETRGQFLAVRTIIPATDGTQHILFLENRRLLVASSPNWRCNAFHVVWLDSPQKNKTLRLEYTSELSPLEVTLFADPRGTAIAVYLVALDAKGHGFSKQILKVIDVATGVVRDGDWNDYRHLQVTGPVGGIQPYEDGSVELFSYSDGQLVFRKGGRSIESGLRLPANFRYAPDDIVFAYVLTGDLVVLQSLFNSPERDGPIGRKTLLIGRLLDKQWQWHRWTVPGDMSWTRRWDNWLGVQVGAARFEVKRTRPSPGLRERRKAPTTTGYPFDWKWVSEYFPGTLLLYNVATRKQYTMETGQGDSEILFVESSHIYYRVNDRIFRGRIGEKSIEEAELMVSRPEVVDIHWAFRSRVGN